MRRKIDNKLETTDTSGTGSWKYTGGEVRNMFPNYNINMSCPPGRRYASVWSQVITQPREILFINVPRKEWGATPCYLIFCETSPASLACGGAVVRFLYWLSWNSGWKMSENYSQHNECNNSTLRCGSAPPVCRREKENIWEIRKIFSTGGSLKWTFGGREKLRNLYKYSWELLIAELYWIVTTNWSQ